jgi:2-polyprenyl-3-methyl-5-hydroxy-6-metoxy-1,4-benzoquinol methylase
VSESAEKYAWKEIPGSSHDLLRRQIRALPAGLRLLDLGAAGGHLGRAVRDRCAFLAGVEPDPGLAASCGAAYDDWRRTDALSAGAWDRPFDAIVCADVLEHLPRPDELLAQIREWLRAGGTLFVSLPNVANLTVRLALLLGRFPYADRGILDRTHLRFYTRRSARDLIEGAGFHVRSIEATAMPYELAAPVLGRAPLSGPVHAFASGSARVWPTLFGYQFVIAAEKE